MRFSAVPAPPSPNAVHHDASSRTLFAAMASGVASTGIPAESAADCRTELLQLLRDRGHPGSAAEAPRVRELLQRLEHLQPANLAADSDRLTGVWELRWSSGRQPYLTVAPWLENLQLLDPRQGRAMNLLRLAGPVAPLAGIAVQARISVEGLQRVGVRFVRGGWLGPRIGDRRLQLLREVNQSFPAWLDITVLDDDLRVCRGNAGTLFALVRRPELRLEDFFGEQPGPAEAAAD
ncbi:MAG: hypothetical protein RLZZ206_2217 [Cyanobacteriota bacterium]|jgi:hypothetical protein